MALARRHQSHYSAHVDSHAPDAGLAAHHLGIDRDAIQLGQGHLLRGDSSTQAETLPPRPLAAGRLGGPGQQVEALVLSVGSFVSTPLAVADTVYIGSTDGAVYAME